MSEIDDVEREIWIDNDEGLFDLWQGSKIGKQAFIKKHRAEIDEVILNIVNHRKPAHYLKYGG